MTEQPVPPNPATDSNVVAELRQASKRFRSGDSEIVALQPTDLKIRRRELLLIIGPSGSGKTTLLSLVGCVMYPTDGCVCVQGTNTRDLSDSGMAELRLREIGFVFQSFNLIAPFTAEENIAAPLILQGETRAQARSRVNEALSLVGLRERHAAFPRELSGGEQQRVAIARALVSDPSIILCDEPTANLDASSIDIVLSELRKLAEAGKGVAVVTHDPRLEKYADRIIHLENGAVVEDTERMRGES